MTYRERRLRKAERLRGWANGRETKAAAAFKTADTIASAIPFGQPILVGHHSEKRHRRDLDRIDGGMRRGIEHTDKARDMRSKADNIEAAAEAAIYSDDPDAVEALEARIAGLEAQRARITATNKAIRKHGLAALVEDAKAEQPRGFLVPALSDGEARELLSLAQLTPWHDVPRKGYPSYVASNLGGNITRNRQRLERLARAKSNRDQWPEHTGTRERVALVLYLIVGNERMTTIPAWSYDATADTWSINDGARAFTVGSIGEADDCFANLERRGIPRAAVLHTIGGRS